jgi:hypothetical protein
MKSPEEFLSEFCRSSRSSVFAGAQSESLPSLHPDVRKAANHGLAVFPVPEVARLTGRPELLIAEATSDFFRLEELAAEHTPCTWRAVVGSSRLCVVRLDGIQGRAWFAAGHDGLDDCRTLSVVRGETAWALFRWPESLVLRTWAKPLASGVSILTDGGSFPVPPSAGSTWVDPWAEIEPVPYWLREIAFEPPPSGPPGKATNVPWHAARPESSRPFRNFKTPQRSVRSGHPSCDQARWRGGFRVSRRR